MPRDFRYDVRGDDGASWTPVERDYRPRMYDDRPDLGREGWYGRERERDYGPHGSEIERDRMRDEGGPRYHGGGWGRAERDDGFGRYQREPMYHQDRRRAQGGPGPNWGRTERRYGEDLTDDGELHHPRGGWLRDDHRMRSGRGMGGDFYGGPDRGYDSLIPPMPEERGRYDAGRFDAPDYGRHEVRWSRYRDDGEPALWDDSDRRRGVIAGGHGSGYYHRR